jgi:hypothetical protein
MELRKRSAAPPLQDTAALAKRAAVEVLNGGHGGSARAAAAHHALPFHSHVQYYIDKWRGSEVAELVALPPTPTPTPTLSVSPVPSPLLPDMPAEERGKSRAQAKTWIAKQAGLLGR